jgi:hypothetical protein
MPRRTRVLLFAAATLVALAAGAVAGANTRRCLPPVCKAGEKSKCCTEPICDFMAQVRMKRALQNFFLGEAERNGVGCSPSADPSALNRERDAQKRKLESLLGDRQFKDRIFGKCDADMADIMPDFKTNASCAIEMNDRPSSREGAHERSRACQEMVDAAYDHEEVHKQKCWKMGAGQRERQCIGDFSAEEVEGYQKEIDSLTSQLKHWAKSCAKTPAGKKLDQQLKQLEGAMKSTERRRTSLERRAGRGAGGR